MDKQKMIVNNIFTEKERTWLNFILKQDFEGKEKTIDYINALTTEEIIRDYSDYHKIIEFRTRYINQGYSGMSEMVSVQTIHNDGSTPTVFTLYAKDGFPFEYEIYNADSSAIDDTIILDGELYIG